MRYKLLTSLGIALLFLTLSGSFFISPVFAKIKFSISNPIIVGDEITIDVSITGTSNAYYLQGMFTLDGTPDYFGWTKNNFNDPVQYVSSPSVDFMETNFFKTTPSQEGFWADQLTLKNDPEDSGYSGPGEYIVRVSRYTLTKGSSARADNDLSVHLSDHQPTPTQAITSTPTVAKTTTPTPTPPKNQLTSTPPSLITTSDTNSTSSPDLVLGQSTPSATNIIPSPQDNPDTNEKETSSTRLPLWITSIGGLMLAGSLSAIFYKTYLSSRSSDKIDE